MKIVCDSCGAKYSIADEKVAGKIFKIRCKKCSSVLEVRGDQQGPRASEGLGGSQDRSSEATWYIVVDGEQKGPLPPIQLSQLFAKGSVGLDSYVWREGFDDWKVAGDVPELAQIFGGAAAQTRQASTTGDDTSAFAAGGDLFGENGREPTEEIEGGGMFGSFDESPTPTDGEPASLAASGSQDVTSDPLGAMGASLGGGALGAATPQRMTGQRNENSVLFSLSNLQQLASGGGPTTSSAQSASQGTPAAAKTATGSEGSGLIDIRALAQSTTPGAKTAPSQSVDDLLAIGAGGGGALGAPLLGPAPVETSDSNRWIWIAGAAIAVLAIVGAGIGVGMALGGGEDDALEIPPPAAENTPDPAQPAQSAAAAEAPEAAPEVEAAAVEEEPAEPEEAATIAEAEPEPEPRSEANARDPQPRRTAPTRRQRPQRAQVQRDDPAPKRRSSNNLDALMDEVVGGSGSKSTAKAASTARSSDSSLPDSPSRDDVKTALQGVSGAVQACRKDEGGTATVNVVFSGKTGRATSARVASGPFKGTPVGSCIESAVKRARLPRFQQSTFKVTFPYRL